MDSTRFDGLTTTLSRLIEGSASRRGLLRPLGGGLAAIALLGASGTEAKRKKKKNDKCKKDQKRCNGSCVNTNTDGRHCGRCGNACAGDARCLHGSCFTDDICPAAQQACPNFVRCGVEDSDCFCGTTTGGETVCFQDEDFCDATRPSGCDSNSDCSGGRVCIDTSGCCEDRNLPAHPRTCLLPCENLEAALAPPTAKRGERQAGPG